MADKSMERAQQRTREAPEEIGVAMDKGADVTRGAGERASDAYEELSVLRRENMEGIARTTGTMLKGAADLGSVWVSFWNAQLIDGMAALRSLSGSRSWQEVLTVQGEFAAATVQRISSVTAESAGLTRDIASGSLRPLQERAHTAARFSRMAA